jgi:hypothetical protein
MLRSGKWGVAWFLALAAMLAYGVWQLLSLRYEVGDVYPPYSTLRSDPLGARALYDAFDELPGLRCRRSFEALERLGSGEGTSLFVLGADWDDFDLTEEDEAVLLDRFMNSGGRLVVVFRGRLGESIFRQSSTQARQRGLRVRKPGGGPTKSAIGTGNELEKRWGIGLAYRAFPTNSFTAEGVAEPLTVRRAEGPPTLPGALEWRSAMVFNVWTNAVPAGAWRHVYLRDGAPVLVERRFGRGSVVLMSDAFFLSNEALWKDRQSELLRWLAGDSRRLVFDETHLGVTEQPGIATLLRRYRLHWVVGAGMVVFGLAIWRNSSPLVPVTDEDPIALAREGRDSRSGLVNLLRRTIPPAEVLGYCFREWRKSGHARRQVSQDRLRRAEMLAAGAEPTPGGKTHPVDVYREIARALRRK